MPITKVSVTNAFMGAWVGIKMDKINIDRREKKAYSLNKQNKNLKEKFQNLRNQTFTD